MGHPVSPVLSGHNIWVRQSGPYFLLGKRGDLLPFDSSRAGAGRDGWQSQTEATTLSLRIKERAARSATRNFNKLL
jgi:hypothetical protein